MPKGNGPDIMPFQVSQDAKDKTTKCQFKFICLTKENHQANVSELPICPGLGVAEGKSIFIQPAAVDDCPYLKRFGFGHFICECPVRYEIYDKHKI